MKDEDFTPRIFSFKLPAYRTRWQRIVDYVLRRKPKVNEYHYITHPIELNNYLWYQD